MGAWMGLGLWGLGVSTIPITGIPAPLISGKKPGITKKGGLRGPRQVTARRHVRACVCTWPLSVPNPFPPPPTCTS